MMLPPAPGGEKSPSQPPRATQPSLCHTLGTAGSHLRGIREAGAPKKGTGGWPCGSSLTAGCHLRAHVFPSPGGRCGGTGTSPQQNPTGPRSPPPAAGASGAVLPALFLFIYLFYLLLITKCEARWRRCCPAARIDVDGDSLVTAW